MRRGMTDEMLKMMMGIILTIMIFGILYFFFSGGS